MINSRLFIKKLKEPLRAYDQDNLYILYYKNRVAGTATAVFYAETYQSCLSGAFQLGMYMNDELQDRAVGYTANVNYEPPQLREAFKKSLTLPLS